MVHFIEYRLTKYNFLLLLPHPTLFSLWPFLFVMPLSGCPSFSQPHLSCESLSVWFQLPFSAVLVDEDNILAIASQNVFNPGHQRADFCVNTWVVRQSTALAPGDNAVQLPVAHQGTTRVTLSTEKDEDSCGQIHDLILVSFTQYVRILARLSFCALCIST